MLENKQFRELTLEKKTTIIKVIDDCCNRWDYIAVYQSLPEKQFKVGGQWKRLVEARRVKHGAYMIVGAPTAGNNNTLYLSLQRL